jgi:hypothetical protein
MNMNVGNSAGRMRHTSGRGLVTLVISTAIVAACGGREGGQTDSSAAAPLATPITVTITSPAEGDTVRGSAVHIALGAAGIELAPAADQRPGTAHHHLYLDTDIGVTDSPIPAGTAGIVHLGKAETEYHWDSVAAGPHRIIAVLADPTHVPLRPLVADTVNIVVVR